MNKVWLLSIIFITFTFLAAIMAQETSSLGTSFLSHKIIKLSRFQKAMEGLNEEEKPLLKLWESILTGRSAPLSKMTKEKYAELGLNHIFTPSGFHLSAVLSPFMKMIHHKPSQLLLLIILGAFMCFLPGLLALKRMILIKGCQKATNLHVGFVVAMLADLFFGTFQNNSLSFTYSFLFLGIIYSGVRSIGLLVWFFIGQTIIAYFNGQDISLLLLIFSPVLNLAFGIAMPILFLCSWPLNPTQLNIGLTILENLQMLVDYFSKMILNFPTLEVSVLTIIGMTLFLFKKWNLIIPVLIFYSHDMNIDLQKRPSYSTHDFKVQGHMIYSREINGEIRRKFSDGNCRAKLVRGFWWETCSPRYKRSRKKT